MALTVLIVEDEQSAQRLLAAIAQEAGLSARVTGSAREAEALCAQASAAGTPFAAMILDVVLPESDGFQFAEEARKKPWGEKLPIVVVSGAYKQLPADFAAAVMPAAFFAKPFEPAALRATLSKLTGASGTAPALEGSLAEKPAAALFVELYRTKATGVLTCSLDGARRVITFQQGLVRFAQSNIRAEAVGAPLVAAGQIKQTSFDRAVAVAKQQGIALHEALAAARVLSPDQLKIALKQQTADVCAGALAQAAGEYRFEQRTPDALSTTPDVRQSPIPLIFEAARRREPAAARKLLEERAQERVQRSSELERELFALKASWPGEGITPLATGGKSIGELLARAREAELPLLLALCQSGLLICSSQKAKDEAKAVKLRAQPSEEDRNQHFTQQEMTARRMLFFDADRLGEASHYEVLGIASAAGTDDLKRAWLAGARRYHSDSFAGLSLGSARKVAEDLFAKVNEAYSVLSDKEKRAEYDVYLDRKQKGLPTDVAAILRAEGLFQKGETLFKIGRFDDAEAQFREAIALNASEAEFHAYLGMTIFSRTGKADDARPHVDKALQLEPKLRSGIVFQAQLIDASGDTEAARALLRKAVEQDPEFAQAKEELRKLRAKPAEESKGGFLSRLLKK